MVSTGAPAAVVVTSGGLANDYVAAYWLDFCGQTNHWRAAGAGEEVGLGAGLPVAKLWEQLPAPHEIDVPGSRDEEEDGDDNDGQDGDGGRLYQSRCTLQRVLGLGPAARNALPPQPACLEDVVSALASSAVSAPVLPAVLLPFGAYHFLPAADTAGGHPPLSDGALQWALAVRRAEHLELLAALAAADNIAAAANHSSRTPVHLSVRSLWAPLLLPDAKDKASLEAAATAAARRVPPPRRQPLPSLSHYARVDVSNGDAHVLLLVLPRDEQVRPFPIYCCVVPDRLLKSTPHTTHHTTLVSAPYEP